MPRFTLHHYNFPKTIVIQVKSSVRRDTIVSTLEASSQQDLGAQSAIRITFCIQRLHTRVKALQLKSNCPLALCESKFCCGLADCAPFDNTAFPTTKQKESNMERFEQNYCTVYTCYTFYIWGGTQQGEEDAADRQRVNVSNFLDTTGGQAGPRATAARRKSQAARQKWVSTTTRRNFCPNTVRTVTTWFSSLC